jgi:inorganic pyrophosphatase
METLSMAVHPWHPWHTVGLGKNAPGVVPAIIEISKGSKNKYEIDKESGLLVMDRVMSSAVFYPANYGFIPQTYCDDGDALDIFVLGQEPAVPLCIMNAKVVGCLRMVDGGEEDDKILAVHASDPHFKHIDTLEQLQQSNPHITREIEQFFRSYKALEKKVVEVKEWLGKADAEKIILKSIEFYNANKEKLVK